MEEPLKTILSNPSICSHILENVSSVKDLKNIRIVSKQWRDASLLKWRTTATLRLVPDKNGLTEITLASTSANRIRFNETMKSLLDFSQFLEVLNKSGHKLERNPFLHYEVISCNLTHLNLEHQLWTTCGQHVQSLKLSNMIIDGKNPYSIIEHVLSNCPVLKSLTLAKPEVCTNSTVAPTERVVRESRKEASPAEHLNSFEVTGIATPLGFTKRDAQRFSILFSTIQRLTLNSVQSGFVQILEETIDSERPIMLQRLKVVDKRSDPDCCFSVIEEYIETVKPPLEYLEWNSYPFEGSLYRILLACQNTLTHLTVNLPDDSYPVDLSDSSSFESPFPHLAYLYLSGEISVGLDDLQKMPNLKLFHLTPAEETGELEIYLEEKDNTVLEHLQEVWVPHGFEQHKWQILARYTPNLQKLKINILAEQCPSNVLKAIQNSDGSSLWKHLETLVTVQHTPTKSDPVVTTFNVPMFGSQPK